MASTTQYNSIWAQMSYVPPRGPCSQKTSIMSSCPCHRFMIHPIKAPTSFECDGCGHHASFHRMDNREEEEIAGRWHTQEAEKAVQSRIKNAERFEELMEVQLDALPPKRRRRIAGVPEVVVDLEDGGEQGKTATGKIKKGRAHR